mmetsp:Transcript_28496/g.66864  ORF Transcript_28496/g.66864 Transcript_28496/m.66864 type:complete len:234 (-) Transcript_28496:554-1255(-)
MPAVPKPGAVHRQSSSQRGYGLVLGAIVKVQVPRESSEAGHGHKAAERIPLQRVPFRLTEALLQLPCGTTVEVHISRKHADNDHELVSNWRPRQVLHETVLRPANCGLLTVIGLQPVQVGTPEVRVARLVDIAHCIGEHRRTVKVPKHLAVLHLLGQVQLHDELRRLAKVVQRHACDHALLRNVHSHPAGVLLGSRGDQEVGEVGLWNDLLVVLGICRILQVPVVDHDSNTRQ